MRAALAWAVEAGDVDTLLRFFTSRGMWWANVHEINYAVQQAAARALEVPGVADDPRYPLVLVEAAFYAAHRGQLVDMARYRAALESCETPLGAEAAAYIEFAHTQIAGAEGRVDLWIEHAKRAVALQRDLPSGPDLAAALTNLALGQTLAVVELDEAVAEVDEALAIIGGNHQLAACVGRPRLRSIRARRHRARPSGLPHAGCARCRVEQVRTGAAARACSQMSPSGSATADSRSSTGSPEQVAPRGRV